jgi:hypothetical protein
LGIYSPYPTPGYELRPTFYLLDGEGTVLWSDESARPRHVETQVMFAELAEAITQALDETERNTRQ